MFSQCIQGGRGRWRTKWKQHRQRTTPSSWLLKMSWIAQKSHCPSLVCLWGLHLAPFEWVNSMMCRPDMFVEDMKRIRKAERWEMELSESQNCPRQIVQKPPEEGGASPSNSDSSAMPYEHLTSMKAFVLNFWTWKCLMVAIPRQKSQVLDSGSGYLCQKLL